MLTGEIRTESAGRTESERDLDAATRRIGELEREKRELQATLAALQGSTLWRAIAPMRAMLDKARRFRGLRASRSQTIVQPGAADAARDGVGHTPLTPAAAVLETGLFDPAFYREAAGLGEVSDLDAAAHYATTGEIAGIQPNPSFDPMLYAQIHRAPGIAAMGLLIHYARYGKAEGRIASFDLDAHLRPGGRPLDSSLPTAVLVCHETSRTGAPILGWNLARHLNRTHNLVVVIAHKEGDLLDIFAREAVLVAGPFLEQQLAPLLMRRLGEHLQRRFSPEFALANSLETEPVLAGLALAGLPTVTLVHEFASSVYPPGKTTHALMMSTQVVFDARAQQDSAQDEWPGITTRNQHVFHQGASEVPAFPNRSGRDGTRLSSPDAVYRAVKGKGGRRVVLGLGTIAMRKGVDLFVACAQAVCKRLGPDRVRFVWIGSKPVPHPDGNYGDWLSDQVKRAGLAETVEFLSEVDDLSGAFMAADILLVSSRLDPFPNVAMDAALAGLPVLCFQRANGFADYLAEDERTRFLAVPYLDTDEAAARIVELLRDEPAHARFGEALKERSARDFPMERYIERLRPVIAAAKDINAQEKLDIALLEGDDTFSAFLWCDPGEPMPRAEAIRRHVRKAASGQEANQYCRRPALGFVPQTYADHRPELQAGPFENPLAHWIRAGKPEGAWTHRVSTPSENTKRRRERGLRTAVHLHLHYPELAPGILAALAVNEVRCDLLVSTTSVDKRAELEGLLTGYDRGAVTIAACPNQGRDIGPMLSLFQEKLQGYDVFGHFHGKRSLALTTVGLSTDLGVQWHEFLLQHLLGPKFPVADLILDRFAENERLGLVFPEDPNLTGWSKDREIARQLARRMDPAMDIPQSIDFPIGTMFWARPTALKPLFDLGLGWSDYPEEPVPIDGTMLHALERLLPVICRHAGFDFETTHVPGVTR